MGCPFVCSPCVCPFVAWLRLGDGRSAAGSSCLLVSYSKIVGGAATCTSGAVRVPDKLHFHRGGVSGAEVANRVLAGGDVAPALRRPCVDREVVLGHPGAIGDLGLDRRLRRPFPFFFFASDEVTPVTSSWGTLEAVVNGFDAGAPTLATAEPAGQRLGRRVDPGRLLARRERGGVRLEVGQMPLSLR